MTTANPIRNVSDTALWVAIYRAQETERPDALFNDPYARRLGGERGEAIARTMPRGAWPMVVRTAVMDEIVLRCVQQGVATVLNLAAGLDARPYRLPLPESLRWLHVDLPDMVDYFRTQMAAEKPRCAIEIHRAPTCAKLPQRREGVRRAMPRRTARYWRHHRGPADLSDRRPGRRPRPRTARCRRGSVVADRPCIADAAEIPGEKLGAEARTGQCAIPVQPRRGHAEAFCAPFGWREAEFRSTWEESFRLKRTMPGAWLWQLLSKLQSKQRQEAGRRMSGIVLMRGVLSADCAQAQNCENQLHQAPRVRQSESYGCTPAMGHIGPS